MKIEDFPLELIEYKRDWQIYLEAPDNECPVYKLMIVSRTMDSYDEARDIRVRHEFMVPPADYQKHVWIAWIFDRFLDVERHEAGEFFKFDTLRVFAPHHGNGQDPYRTWFIGSYEETRTKAGNEDDIS